MEYIKNELLRCRAELQRAKGEKYSFLYSVQQALAWALDPMSCATPVDTVLNGKVGTMDIPLSSEDCLAAHRPLPSRMLKTTQRPDPDRQQQKVIDQMLSVEK